MLLGFDDLQLTEDTNGLAYSLLPAIYNGFSFPNVYAQRIPPDDTVFGYNTGYRFGTRSLPNHAFNEYGRPFTMIATDQPFDNTNLFSLDSLFVTAAFTSDMQIQILGIDPTNATIASTNAQLSDFHTPMLIEVNKNEFKGLTGLRISSVSTSTTPVNIPKAPLHFVVDDIIVCSS